MKLRTVDKAERVLRFLFALDDENVAYVLVSLRRTVAMLRQIGKQDFIQVEFTPAYPSLKSGMHTLDKVDDLRNAVVLLGHAADGTSGRVVPLEVIITLFFDECYSPKGRWRLRVDTGLTLW